ncbi:MAG: hypothetical protein Q7T21_10915 [Gallionella sp.]|nr:hypothetical protein [Gallionella sp.]
MQAIKPAPQVIEPPDGWELHSPFGYMRCDPTHTGPLVRLADVLHWLESTRSLPRVAALEALCEAMPPDVVSWLYWVRPTDYAKPVPVNFMFGFMTAAQIEAKRQADITDRIRRGLQRERENQSNGRFGATWRFESAGRKITTILPEPTEPGRPALLKLIRHCWVHSKRTPLSTCDILDDPKMHNVVNLAIRLDKAAALWGYGQILRAVDSEPSTFAELVTLRKAKPGSTWTKTARQIISTEVASRITQPGHRKAIAEALQVTPSRIGQLIDQNWQPKRRPAANLQSVKG